MGKNRCDPYGPTGQLAPGTTYYWKVVVHHAAGNTIEGPVWEFTTADQPVADFAADRVSGYGSLLVTFTDQYAGLVDSRAWDFGDGATSTEQNPSHRYTAPGAYTVSLTVEGPGG